MGHADDVEFPPQQREETQGHQQPVGEAVRHLQVLGQAHGEVRGVGGGDEQQRGGQEGGHPQAQAQRGPQSFHRQGPRPPLPEDVGLRIAAQVGIKGGENHQRDGQAHQGQAPAQHLAQGYPAQKPGGEPQRQGQHGRDEGVEGKGGAQGHHAHGQQFHAGVEAVQRGCGFQVGEHFPMMICQGGG